jgi:hypothetical protein
MCSPTPVADCHPGAPCSSRGGRHGCRWRFASCDRCGTRRASLSRRRARAQRPQAHASVADFTDGITGSMCAEALEVSGGRARMSDRWWAPRRRRCTEGKARWPTLCRSCSPSWRGSCRQLPLRRSLPVVSKLPPGLFDLSASGIFSRDLTYCSSLRRSWWRRSNVCAPLQKNGSRSRSRTALLFHFRELFLGMDIGRSLRCPRARSSWDLTAHP